jgi:xylan 1,4-beta-xylosidase
MHKIKICQFLFFLLLLQGKSILAQPVNEPQTFCNPLNLNYRFMADAIDAREAADPVIVLFKDDYYLFASRSGGYWTSPDLRTWTFIIPQGIDIESYAPAVVAMRDSLFYLPSGTGQIYKTGDPKAGVWQRGPSLTNYGDPALFLDDDEKLFLSHGVSNVTPISVVELDPVTFKEKGSKVDVISAQASVHGWERRGDDNLLDEQPWIEGSWMIKSNNKYYLHYACPGTEFKTYADGIYVADAPLGPYEYAPYSPFSFKPTGFITGAGHGCTFKDKNGNYWHIGTMTISVKHMFERRLGIAPVAFDEDGQIHSNNVWGDYPQYFPGVKDNPIDNNFTGMMLLSYKKYAMASSSLENYGIDKAIDEEARTYWCAQTGGPDEWMMIDLGKECSIEAIQVNFAEHNTNPDRVRGRDNLLYEQYILEQSTDGMNWSVLVDKSRNMQDVPHDYVELDQPVLARYIKLINVFTPGGGNFAVRDLRIFGNTDQAVFTTVSDFTVERDPEDGRDAVIRWTPVANADGYIINYGIAPGKLYNSYMVYDTDSIAIHSLNHGVEYYFSVKAFDNGTDYYSPVGEIRSYQSGNWNDVNTWAQYDGSSWIHPASINPSESDKPVTILDGHTITLLTTDSVGWLTVANGGTLVINQGTSFHVKNGIETDLMVEGTLRNYGTVTLDSLATISFAGNGIYEHKQNGGSIPQAIWRPNSTISFDSIKTAMPSNSNQDFYNLLWNCPDQTANVSMLWNGNTIGGNITIQNTGTAILQMCDPAPGDKTVVNINGNIIQYGGQFTSHGSDNANTNITINHYGNIDITGGNFPVSLGSQGGSGTTTWNLHGNVSLTDATTQNSNPGGASFVFTRNGGSQTLSFSEVLFGEGGFPVEVDSGATLDIATSILQGDGSFNLKAGATLMTAHKDGINGSIANTGPKTLDKASSFAFYGSVAQVTGDLLPDTVHNFTINNALGVTLSNSVVIDGTMDLENGNLTLNNKELSYGADASLKYSGKSAQTTTDAEFPFTGGPCNLIIANSKSVILHASRTICNLDLNYKLELGSNTLTVDSISNEGTSAYIVTTDGGVLSNTSVGASQVLFPVGTTSYSPVWIANAGTFDRIGVGVVQDTEESAYKGRLKIKWSISEDIPGGGDYTIQFGWMSASEDADFKTDRLKNAKIFNLSDTTEAGTGDYTTQFIKRPFTVARGGITNLGPFCVGLFSVQTGRIKIAGDATDGFILFQNYPNPFHSSTIINFEIPVTSFVSLKIYNLFGEEMVDLAEKDFLPGSHSVIFDATGFTCGIYYCTLRVRDFVQTKSLILL